MNVRGTYWMAMPSTTRPTTGQVTAEPMLPSPATRRHSTEKAAPIESARKNTQATLTKTNTAARCSARAPGVAPGLGEAAPPARLGAGPLQRQAHAVHAAPEDEGPAGAVPEAAEQHGHDEVHVGAAAALAVAAQRDVQVVAQPARQGDVPAAPEVLDGARRVRRVEVLGQLEAEQQRDADGDVAVGAEVAVDLHGVGGDGPRRLPGRVRLRRQEDAVDDVRGQVVGDPQLLGEAAEDEDEGAARRPRCAGSCGEASCGRKSRARAMGPASRYGKKATYTPKSRVEAGASWPR